MITPIIVGPVMLPEMPEPTISECQTLLTYASELVDALEKVQARVNEISTSPDESLLTIQGRVSMMLSEAEQMKRALDMISVEATNKSSLGGYGTQTF